MKKITCFVLILLCSSLTQWSFAQNSFNSCSAAFLDNKLVVDDYSPEGKCKLLQETKGMLTVAEATYENNQWRQTAPVDFMVAIRDKNSKTLMMYSTEIYQKIDLQKIITQCQKGDYIVLLTTKNKYALPHNEILVQ